MNARMTISSDAIFKALMRITGHETWTEFVRTYRDEIINEAITPSNLVERETGFRVVDRPPNGDNPHWSDYTLYGPEEDLVWFKLKYC